MDGEDEEDELVEEVERKLRGPRTAARFTKRTYNLTQDKKTYVTYTHGTVEADDEPGG